MSRGYSNELYDSYLKYLEDGSIPQNVSSTAQNFKREAKKHTNLNGVLLRKGKLVLKVNELSSEICVFPYQFLRTSYSY